MWFKIIAPVTLRDNARVGKGAWPSGHMLRRQSPFITQLERLDTRLGKHLPSEGKGILYYVC